MEGDTEMQTGRNKRWWAALSILALVYLSGAASRCDAPEEGEPPGAAQILWRVSPLGCEAAGVEVIRVRMEGPTVPAPELLNFRCADELGLVDALEMGRYTVTLEGLDQDGDVTFLSPPMGFSVSPQTTTVTPTVRLSARAAQLEVAWYFENGRLCASNEVDQVVLSVFDADAFLVGEQAFPCDHGVGGLEGLQSGTFWVEVLGLSAGGVTLFRVLEQVELKRGQEATLELGLAACTEDAC
jgi:hypothetical protein